jgi:Tfp pilus assembly protein PilV
VTATAPRRDERGETLIELLVSVLILGTAFIAILAGVGVAIASSDGHRQEATAEGVLRNYAERVQDSRDVPYADCAGVSSYATVPGFSSPAGWTVSVTQVSYLETDNTFGGTCPSPDRGAQQLTLRAVSPHPDNGATETITIVKGRR